MKATVRWALFFAALLGLGPALWLLTHGLRAADGVSPTSPGLAGAAGLAIGVVVVVLLGGMGMLVARLTSLRWGVFVAGVAAAWAAAGVGGGGGGSSGGGGGALADVLRTAPASALGSLAVEGFVLGAVLVVGVIGMHWAAGRRPGGDHDPARAGWRGGDHAHRAHAHHRDETWAARVGLADLATSVAVAVAAGFIVPALVAQSGLKGQTVAGALLAGLLAATAGSFLSRRWGHSPIGPAVGLAIVAGAAPLVASLMVPAGSLVRLANDGSILAAAKALPLDWVAGALLGIPLGLAWGQSLAGTKISHGSSPRPASAPST